MYLRPKIGPCLRRKVDGVALDRFGGRGAYLNLELFRAEILVLCAETDDAGGFFRLDPNRAGAAN